MAALYCTTSCKLSPPTTEPISNFAKFCFYPVIFSIKPFTRSLKLDPSKNSSLLTTKRRNWVIGPVTENKEVVSVKNSQLDEEDSLLVGNSKELEGVSFEENGVEVDENNRLIGRAINATIVLGTGTVVTSKLLTIDHDYWHGWTLYEVLRYLPAHNWIAYEQALETNPVLAKMAISGYVYSVGDWIAQCYEGKPLFDFNPQRMFRSGLVGFTLHGSLSHYYYQFCEVVPAKVALDQTMWAAIWNSIYYLTLWFLRFEYLATIFSELKATFWPMLTAGWKLWPFAHLVTYGIIPCRAKASLWSSSGYSNKKSEARIFEVTSEANSKSSSSSREE